MKNYKYKIDGRVLFIEGAGPNGKTLTNSMDEVVREIGEEMGTSMENFDIIYRDSDGLKPYIK